MTTPISEKKILICGTGSIGQRHARNVRALGVQQIAVYDPDTVKRSALAAELSCDAFADLDEALATFQPDVVFVCSPTKHHVAQAIAAANAGADLFIEKPLNHTMEGIAELKQMIEKKDLICMVGCNMRFHHGPSVVRKLVEQKEIGEITDAEVTVAFNFTGRADFANDVEKYRHSYNADPQQGGAVRECVHEIDLSMWYFGDAKLESATKEMATPLQLPDVEGTADLYLSHKNGVRSHVHVSFMEPEYRRYCKINGEKGSIEWHFGKEVVVRDTEGTVTSTYTEPEGYDVNQMYLDETTHFFNCVENHTMPQGHIDDAIRALKLALETLEKAEVKTSVS